MVNPIKLAELALGSLEPPITVNSIVSSIISGGSNFELPTTAAVAAAITNATGNIVTTPGGNTTDIQFNSSGSFAGSDYFTFNTITNTISVGNSTVNVTINTTSFSGTSNNSLNLNGTSLSTIQSQITGNATTAYTNAVANAAALYQTAAGLSANVSTLTANNASNFNGQPASYYTNATNITTGTLPYAQLGTNVVNTSAAFTLTGVQTYNANLVMVGNSTALISLGNSSVNVTVNSTTFSGTSNNSSNFNGQPASYYGNASNITAGTLPWAQSPTNSVNTTGAFTFNGVETFNANLILVGNSTNEILTGNSTVNTVINSSGFYVNGSVLSPFSNGTSYIWSATETFNSNVTIVGNTTSIFTIGNSTINTQVNSSALQLISSSNFNGINYPTGSSSNNQTILQSVNVAGKSFLSSVSNVGISSLVQTIISQKNIIAISPSVGSSITYIGMPAGLSNTAGTATGRTPSLSSNKYSLYKRQGYVSTAAAGSNAGYFAQTNLFIGNTTIGGGWFFYTKFGISNSPDANTRFFAGLTANGAALLGNSNPSAQVSILGVGFESTSGGVWNTYQANATVCNNVSLGLTDLNSNVSIYEVALYCPALSGSVSWLFNAANNTTSFSNTGVFESTHLPLNSLHLNGILWINSGAAAGSAVGLDLINMYAESDY